MSFITLGHEQKLIYIKYKHVKYSCDLIWATYDICGLFDNYIAMLPIIHSLR